MSTVKRSLWLIGIFMTVFPCIYECTRDHREIHEVPAICSNRSGDVQRDPTAHHFLCAAHYYARACSGGSSVGCSALADLADRDPQPEIRELAHRYKVIP